LQPLCCSTLQDSWSKTEAIIYVTAAQLLCGIAKDLTKLGGKTVTKLVTPGGPRAGCASGCSRARLFTCMHVGQRRHAASWSGRAWWWETHQVVVPL
jgi:hypothetical protein